MRKREKQARQREYSKRNREKRNLSGEVRYEVWIPKEGAETYKNYIRQVVEYFKQQADKKTVQQ